MLKCGNELKIDMSHFWICIFSAKFVLILLEIFKFASWFNLRIIELLLPIAWLLTFPCLFRSKIWAHVRIRIMFNSLCAVNVNDLPWLTRIKDITVIKTKKFRCKNEQLSHLKRFESSCFYRKWRVTINGDDIAHFPCLFLFEKRLPNFFAWVLFRLGFQVISLLPLLRFFLDNFEVSGAMKHQNMFYCALRNFYSLIILHDVSYIYFRQAFLSFWTIKLHSVYFLVFVHFYFDIVGVVYTKTMISNVLKSVCDSLSPYLVLLLQLYAKIHVRHV